ncbi:MAG: hypothetical protein HPY74_02250 [Firmicutes bacterium]|nr:hypothetical protein [Bacillota bacterium]
MWSKLWNISKRAVSLAAKFSFLYPVIFLPRAALFKDTGGIAGFLIGLVILFSGYIITGLIVKNKQDFSRMLLSYLLSIIPAAVLAFVHINQFPHGVLRAFFEGMAASLLYFTGARTRVLAFDLILSRKVIITGVIIFLVSIIFVNYYKELAYLKNLIYYLGYVFTALTLLIKNQQNLDRVFIKKHIELSTVPKDIRKYNSIIVMVVFLVILALFNIKTLIDFITVVLGNMPKYLLRIIFFILYLLSKLLPESEGGMEQDQGGPHLPALPDGESNSIVGLILTIVFGSLFVVVAVFLLSKFPKLLRAFGEKIKKLFMQIAVIFKKLFKFQKEYMDKEEDYVDEVEIIRPDNPRKGFGKQNRIFQKISRKLGRNLTPAEKVRNMYAGILQHLKAKGINLLKSDTTHEIYKKIPQTENLGEIMGYITKVYDKVRYGEKTPERIEFEYYEDKAKEAVDILRSKI